MLPDASTPEGMRIYAIGDVHGCFGQMGALHALIARDLTDRPVADLAAGSMSAIISTGARSASAWSKCCCAAPTSRG